MPVNETGRVIIHKGLGNRIIQPGQEYPGREVGPDGDYLPEPKEESSEVTRVEIPSLEELESLTVVKLKELAGQLELEYSSDIRKADLISLIDAARAAGSDQ